MTRPYTLLFCCLLASWQSISQYAQVTDGYNPVADAAIKILSLENDEQGLYISDEKGQVYVHQTPPYIAVISHLNFETQIDTIYEAKKLHWTLPQHSQTLGEVVVTGQFLPQSARQSVYNVQILDRTRIAAQGAQSITDVLASELNFRFQRDNAVGSSNASLQGLSGQNIKVLLDGVPMVGRSGVSNEIDLAQININSIEKVEVVQGPMAVNYGADALAGVINIITKSSDATQWSLNLSLQEESVGREYEPLGDGRHNASLSAAYHFNSTWSIQSETRYQKFGGWSGEGRNKLWYPKTQFFQSGRLRYEKKNLSIYYRLDFLNETLENLGTPEQTSDQEDPYAFDKEYLTTRWMHQVQADYSLKQGSLNAAISLTDYKRLTHRFKSFLIPGVPNVTTTDGQDSIAFKTYFFRNTFNDVLQWSLGSVELHTQFGIDGTFETARGTTLNQGDKQMTDLALFSSIEIQWGDQLKVRPGLRLSHNNTFNTNPSASVNLKYDINKQSQIRVSYGRGFRAPSLRELYHEFVDNNHNILGNPNLRPEYSNNLNGDFTHDFNNREWKFSISGFYNAIHNRISYFTPEGANQATTYTNISKFKTLGSSGFAQFEKGLLKVKAGGSYIGRYHSFSEDASNLQVPEFLYSPEFIANIQYDLLNTGIKLASYYKFTGPAKRYLSVSQDDGSSDLELRQLDGFHFWDLSLSKTFAQHYGLALGAKNLLDVTSVSNSTNTGSAHSNSAGGQSSIAYGRSFFIKFNYNFSK